MKASAKQYAQALFLETRSKDQKELEIVIEKFLNILRRDNSFSQLEKIVFYFNQYWNKDNNLVEAEIKSARDLGPELDNDLSVYLKNISEANNMELVRKVDDKIIGGFVLKYGDKILDFSIKNKINSFKSNLLN